MVKGILKTSSKIIASDAPAQKWVKRIIGVYGRKKRFVMEQDSQPSSTNASNLSDSDHLLSELQNSSGLEETGSEQASADNASPKVKFSNDLTEVREFEKDKKPYNLITLIESGALSECLETQLDEFQHASGNVYILSLDEYKMLNANPLHFMYINRNDSEFYFLKYIIDFGNCLLGGIPTEVSWILKEQSINALVELHERKEIQLSDKNIYTGLKRLLEIGLDHELIKNIFFTLIKVMPEPTKLLEILKEEALEAIAELEADPSVSQGEIKKTVKEKFFDKKLEQLAAISKVTSENKFMETYCCYLVLCYGPNVILSDGRSILRWAIEDVQSDKLAKLIIGHEAFYLGEIIYLSYQEKVRYIDEIKEAKERHRDKILTERESTQPMRRVASADGDGMNVGGNGTNVAGRGV